MKLFFASLLMCSMVSVVIATDLTDYQVNPQKLEQALANCPTKHPSNVSCAELAQIATNVNRLVGELQDNPQAYGASIIELQATLAEQLAQQRQQPSPQLQQQIAQNQSTLDERLSVIKWLESPRRAR